MSKKGNHLIQVAVAAGLIYGTKKIIDEFSKQDNGDSFAQLLKDQAVYDVLDKNGLMVWFREKEKMHQEKTLFFLGRVTKDNASMLAISSLPKDLDTNHTLFQALVNEEGKTLEVRIISFATLSDEVEKWFEGKNHIFIC